MKIERIDTDILIIGGGTAGCFGALTLADTDDTIKVLIVEKANIKRSGCLAAGVNAINAYISEGRTALDYVEYAREDAEGIVRGDLLLTMSKRLNAVTKKLEQLGLVILKDEKNQYVLRGSRNIKINGENIKPILAKAVKSHKNVTILNHVNMIDYVVKNNRIVGAFGIGLNEEVLYVIVAKAIICATGGASGLYRPNNPGFSRHKMWYSPFNTGAGYAMGIRAGAEMTTFEMRFIALRCKDTIAPTGTIAQGVGAKQVNSLGEIYEDKYGLTTSNRIFGTVTENKEGRGPCFLKTTGITKSQDTALLKAYLNMAPSQTLKWLESEENPSRQDVEIEGTEPYIVGGHTASGYWVDTNRATTIPGLYAAGDVAGGCPQKYVSGALAEGEIAAISALNYIGKNNENEEITEEEINKKLEEINCFFDNSSVFTTEELEEAMQKVMDQYAGGISVGYQFNQRQLTLANEKIHKLSELTDSLKAHDMYSLMKIYELRERLLVCKTVIAHLSARKETRWHSFAENLDYPDKDNKNWLKYVNSIRDNGIIRIIFRDLIRENQHYEHNNQ